MTHENSPQNPGPDQDALGQAREVLNDAGPHEVARDENFRGEVESALEMAAQNIVNEPNDAVAEARDAVDTAIGQTLKEAADDAMQKISESGLSAGQQSFDRLREYRRGRMDRKMGRGFQKGVREFRSSVVDRRHRRRWR